MKGQLTIFVVLGILIVLAMAGFILYGTKSTNNAAPEFTLQMNGIKDCAQAASTSALLSIGLQGGRIYPINSEWSFSGKYGYAVFNDSVIVPSRSNVEMDMETFVGTSLKLCGKNYVDSVNLNIINISVDDNVTWVKGEYVAFIGEKSFSGSFVKKYDVRLGYILDSVKTYAYNSLNRSFIVLSPADFEVYSIRLNKDAILFRLSDLKSVIDGNVYEFDFILPDNVKINGSGIFVESLKRNLTVGERFYHKLNYTGTNLTFDAITTEFDVVNGSVDWTPRFPGNYSVKIVARNSNEDFSSGFLEFNVQ